MCIANYGILDQSDISGVTYNIRPAPEFSFDRGKAKLVSLKIGVSEDEGQFIIPSWNNASGPGEDGVAAAALQGNPEDNKQRYLKLMGWVDAESNEVSVGCAGAILMHLKRMKSVTDPFAEGDELVSNVGMWSMDKIMYIY